MLSLRKVITASLVVAPTLAYAGDWVTGVTQDCYGDVNVASGLSVWWSPGITIGSSGVAGRYYVLANKADVNDSINNNKLLLVDQVELDQPKATSLRNILQTLAGDYKVPVFVELGTNIYLGLAMP